MSQPHNFRVSRTIQQLLSLKNEPYKVGLACGELLHAVPTLVAYHMDEAYDFKNNPSRVKASIDPAEFASAVDALLQHLRRTDGHVGKFPGALSGDQKERKLRRKYMELYTSQVEKAVKTVLKKEMRGVFLGWDGQQTEGFNKGLDRALTGAAWARYPKENVVLATEKQEWSEWLRSQCEALGMVEAAADRRVLGDL
ncbi:hypothetical protein CC80DRAFT_401445 [Byssothecium circinans]|uniref:Uncharacterized protein n=1 Tax=Byssothecium circinans TaxID=147558 RepID=A0A6A5UBY9_9PLEO|nr:hypothetical protein CC80DRAFT_401445 [Byssothecium circinans]